MFIKSQRVIQGTNPEQAWSIFQACSGESYKPTVLFLEPDKDKTQKMKMCEKVQFPH